MAKVYVSSTFNDLKECRARVNLALRKIGHEDVSMEYYVAGDERPVERSLTDVAACDLYVGLFAWRYGYAPKRDNPEGLSITEMEYSVAQRLGKPCLIFMLSEDAPWPRRLMDTDATRIERLRAELSAKHSVGIFTSAEDINDAVYPAVYRWSEEHGQLPRTSFIPELDLTAYYNAIIRRYQYLDLDTLTPPQRDENLRQRLREIFVEQNVRENPPPVELPKEVWEKLQRDRIIHAEDLPAGITPEDVLRARQVYVEKPLRPVLDVLTDPHHRHSVILGDPFSGKSTLARYILLSLLGVEGDAKLRRAFEGHLPLLIELRSYAGLRAEAKCDTFLEFIEYLSREEGWGLDRAALERYLKEDGRAVLLFDGLDEIFDPEEREAAARRIAGFAASYPKARVVVTSRVIGYRRKVLTDADFSHFTLQDLDERQVEQFTDRWYVLALDERPDEARARRERIMRSFKDSPSIRQLAGNPMLLTIMAIIGKNQELPRERWKLYDHAASVLIHHWDVERHLRDRHLDAPFIGEEEKKELLRRLAFRMQSGEGGLAGNYIHRDDLQREFESYLRDRFAQTHLAAAAIARAMIEQFRERNFILSLHGANLYGFVHRAFLEFFCASAFVQKFEKTKEITLEEAKRKFFRAHWQDRSWHEVLRLICGMLDEVHAGALIEYLASRVPLPENGYTPANPPWNVALAVLCLSEIRNPGTVADTALRVLNVVCALFEKGLKGEMELGTFLNGPLAASVETVGTAWPGREVLTDWLLELEPPAEPTLYAEGFGRFVGTVGGGLNDVREEVLSYAEDRNPRYRVLVPFTLAKGWRGVPETLPLVRRLALEDDDGDVRSTAILALADYYRDEPEVLPLLKQRAIADEDARVRYAAFVSLVKNYRDVKDLLPFFRERAASDPDAEVQSVAIYVLAEHGRSDPETLTLLRGRAVDDERWAVRLKAALALAEYYRDDPGTLPLLKRVMADPSERVRAAVSQALAERFGADGEILPLLRKRADDAHRLVRTSVVQALAVHLHDDARTLPLLRNWATRASNEDVRQEAIRALAENFSADAQTLPLIRECATARYPAATRETAVRCLAIHYPGDSKTLPLLQDIARDDVSDSEVRATAISALATGWPDEINTLPLLDSLSSESEPQKVRQAAAEAGLSIRGRRVAAWVDWLNTDTEEEALEALPATAVGFPALTVRTVRLQNIRAFGEPAEFRFGVGDSGGGAAMTLLLGDNATGKSTLLRCMALAALGAEMANQVEKLPGSYLRYGAERGTFEVSFNLQIDSVSDPGALGTFCVGLMIRAGENSFLPMSDADLRLGERNATGRLDLLRRRTDDKFGFLCAYGAQRSLADNPSALLAEEPKEPHERVISLFRSTSPLMDPDVLGKMLAGDLSNFRNVPAKELDEETRRHMAEHLRQLMLGTVETDQSHASLINLHGQPILLRDLSEGYGSLLALVGHLFRQALSAKNWRGDPAEVFGAVLIDEVDLHLHPAWQRRVLPDLRAVFPNLQFICTTHSAMVAGSIGEGTIVVLRREGDDVRTLSGDALVPAGGWSSDQILTSQLFELPTTRSLEIEERFNSYAELLKELGPEDPKVRELGAQVSKVLELEGEGVVDAETHRLLDELLTLRFKRLSEKTRRLVLAKAGLMLSDGEKRHD